MAINKKNDICEYALNSLNDVISFARFVSYAEDLPQLNELLKMSTIEIIIRKYGLN